MTLREQFAKTLRESVGEFTQRWPQRAMRMNEAQLGGRYFDFWQRFPESLDEPANRDVDG